MPSGGKRPGTGPKSKAEKAVIAAISIKDAARFSTMFGKVMTKPVEAAKGAVAMVEVATGGAASTAAGAAVPGKILPQILEEPNMTRKRTPASWRAGERIDGASMTSSADAPLQARQKVEDLIMQAQVAHRDLANSEDNQVQHAAVAVTICFCTPIGERLARLLEEALFLD